MGDGRVEKNNLNKSRQACFTMKGEGQMPVVTGYIQVIERKGQGRVLFCLWQKEHAIWKVFLPHKEIYLIEESYILKFLPRVII